MEEGSSIMPHHGKKQQPSAAKKQTQVSQEDNLQAQQQFAQYHQIAQSLHNSTEPSQAEAALAAISSMPEAAQMALLKALGKEHTVDSADVLLAINTLAPLKEVRKEARRSLIQLEATKTYPQWTPPVAQTPVTEETAPAIPPRFWKGEYTDTRAIQEIQLALYWEQGERYKEVRMMGFLLDYMAGGVKDFFTEVLSRRQAENRMASMRSLMGDLTIVPCTLAQGRKLLLEALDVNKKHKTKPHPDYTSNLPLIQELLLSAPAGDTTEDDQTEQEQPVDVSGSALLRLAEKMKPLSARDVIRHIEELNAREEEDMFDDEDGEDLLDDFDIEETIESFLLAWAEQDYEEAYSLLASTSDLREGLTQDEWVERREAWAEQAQPEGLKYDIVLNLDDEPLPPNVVSMHKEIEVFWSIELQDTSLSTTLSELPMGTAVYKETGRHWFWVKYRLVEEDEEWRIQSMIDEGAAAQQLSLAELEQRIDTIAQDVKALAQEIHVDMDELDDSEHLHLVKPEEDEGEEESDDLDDALVEEIEAEDRLHQLTWMTTRAMHYSDALMAQAPDNYTYYDIAGAQASAMLDWERTATYLESMAQQFPEERGDALAVLAVVLSHLCTQYEEEDKLDRAGHFLTLLEQTLRDSIATDHNFLSTLVLANLLIMKEENLEEAETLLLQAQTVATAPKEQAQVEHALAKLADARDQPELALQHYQRTAELDPEAPDIWFNIGSVQSELNQTAEATQSFLRAIQAAPEDSEAYVELARIYMEQGKLASAREILDEGLDIIDDAADLNAARSMVYTLEGHFADAEELLTEAEEIDPDLEIVQEARQLLKARKAQRQASKSKFRKNKPKKR